VPETDDIQAEAQGRGCTAVWTGAWWALGVIGRRAGVGLSGPGVREDLRLERASRRGCSSAVEVGNEVRSSGAGQLNIPGCVCLQGLVPCSRG